MLASTVHVDPPHATTGLAQLPLALHVPDPPQHEVRNGLGLQVPGVDPAQVLHSSLQPLDEQQTLSTQKLLEQSVVAVHARPLGRFVRHPAAPLQKRGAAHCSSVVQPVQQVVPLHVKLPHDAVVWVGQTPLLHVEATFLVPLVQLAAAHTLVGYVHAELPAVQ
jgi:hypothetical protein